MVVAYKLIAVMVAYGVLWDALSRWRVGASERRLQLQVYGAVVLFYCLIALGAGGAAAGWGSLTGELSAVDNQCVRGFFAAFAVLFLVLGAAEVAISMAFHDPSLPLISRWWVRALFDGPVFRLLSRRRPGTPLLPDEAETFLRHAFSGLVTVGSSVWGIQVALGNLEWGHVDPVAVVILLRALNVWFDGRIWNRDSSAELVAKRQASAPAPGC